jgi:UDP-N-acetylglucosamine--N-acetylmuramyl-(pentapeptide) pyrophosphoryl-undecaprenol N-acetylglucosamine transferase
MTYLIAAAGTGGHVFPGLAVGEALLEMGVSVDDVIFAGGDRLEATVYPREGFRFIGLELAGLQRSLTPKNLRLPAVVRRARNRLVEEMEESKVEVVLGMGGYVTIPAGMAARSLRLPLFNSEQNAEAGLANKITARWARVSFTSFPTTGGLEGGRWVGNPLRRPFWDFDRASLAPVARELYGLEADLPTLGVFGGSLGAGVINEAVARIAAAGLGRPMQIVHLTGETHLDDMLARDADSTVSWRRVGFEERMELFYAATDLVLARSGGAVAELTATATPSILVPGSFGSGGHQLGNARALADAGAAKVVPEEAIDDLGGVVGALLFDPDRLAEMSSGAVTLAKPDAAVTIARAMIEAAI